MNEDVQDAYLRWLSGSISSGGHFCENELHLLEEVLTGRSVKILRQYLRHFGSQREMMNCLRNGGEMPVDDYKYSARLCDERNCGKTVLNEVDEKMQSVFGHGLHGAHKRKL